MNLVVHKPDSLMLHILVFKYIANLLQKLVCYVKPKKKIKTKSFAVSVYGTITE